MAEMLITQDDILRSTLFHIQLKQCQYIDNFPETVTEIFQSMINGKKLKPYDDMKRKLYRIKTNFFDINGEKVVKRDFYLGLYNRIKRKSEY
ncbi:MAG: hypothetical protein P1Q69_04365 [Candidatus Thorarchaeota archaeon]|nr:hypothetical protein [Candidatus Thorarchaeota archaeon]